MIALSGSSVFSLKRTKSVLSLCMTLASSERGKTSFSISSLCLRDKPVGPPACHFPDDPLSAMILCLLKQSHNAPRSNSFLVFPRSCN